MPLTFEETSQTVKNGTGVIHYHVAGEGDPLILIHGSGPGVTGWANFAGNLPIFAQHFRTYVIDLPGYGRSTPVEGHPMSVAVEALSRFMDDLEIQRAHIIGNSLGGMVGSLFAAQHPSRIDRFVSIGGIGFELFSGFPSEGINLLVEFAEDPTRDRLIQWLRSMVFDQSIVTDELIEQRLKQALVPEVLENSRKVYSREAMQGLKEMMRGPNATQSISHFSSIQAPTLLTWGREDRVTLLDRAFIALRLIPDCQLHIFPNCGHWVMIEQKQAFESLALCFLKPVASA